MTHQVVVLVAYLCTPILPQWHPSQHHQQCLRHLHPKQVRHWIQQRRYAIQILLYFRLYHQLPFLFQMPPLHHIVVGHSILLFVCQATFSSLDCPTLCTLEPLLQHLVYFQKLYLYGLTFYNLRHVSCVSTSHHVRRRRLHHQLDCLVNTSIPLGVQTQCHLCQLQTSK